MKFFILLWLMTHMALADESILQRQISEIAPAPAIPEIPQEKVRTDTLLEQKRGKPQRQEQRPIRVEGRKIYREKVFRDRPTQ